MLNPASYDVAPVGMGRQGRPDGRIVAFRATAREDDLLRLSADQSRRLVAGLADSSPHLASEGMHARGVSIKVTEIWQHGIENLFCDLRCSIVVEINRFHVVTSSITSSGDTKSRSFNSTKCLSVISAALQVAHVP